MTAPISDELITGFPHNILPKVTGEPTFEDLKIICCYINTNTTSVSSYEGEGRHGHRGITMVNAEYVALAMVVYTVPENTGATSVHTHNATAA
jgi:hypothetical protein